MPVEKADLVIVGAGAAGLMAAIAAGSADSSGKLRILLLDSRQRIGAKILISGGTRCNVTNVKIKLSDYEGEPRHFIKHVLEAFTPDQTIAFFEKIGVELILEETGKYFPTTHSGKTVLEALMKETERVNVNLKTGVRIVEISKDRNLFHLNSDAKEISFSAKEVILATGGLSYPETGSDGVGLKLAQGFGHSLVETSPALTPLVSSDEGWRLLSGITLVVRLSFFSLGKKKAEKEGSFLFTHTGFSGPAALDISRYVARAKPSDEPTLEASFLPDHTEESLKRSFEDFQRDYPGKLLKSFLTEICSLPGRFVEVYLEKTGFGFTEKVSRLSQIKIRRLIHQLLNYPLEVTGVVGYKKAEVTAGGVDLTEVQVSTMESKCVKGLYFAGEILNVDGRIGGFNFQWAWSSGTVAGRSAAKELLV